MKTYLTAAGLGLAALAGSWFVQAASSQVQLRTIDAGLIPAASTSATTVLRILNTGTRDGTVTVQLRAPSDGRLLASWTAGVTSHASADFNTATIVAAAAPPALVRYQIALGADFQGLVQTLTTVSASGAIINASSCGPATVTAGRALAAVGTTPSPTSSSIITVHNPLAREQTASLEVYEAAHGQRLGVYNLTVPPNTTGAISPAALAVAIGGAQGATVNIVLASGFVGHLQMTTDDLAAGTAIDAATACALPTAEIEGLTTPVLPARTYAYADADIALPAHYKAAGAALGNVAATDNTPAANPTTNAGAALGRALFYDRRLSVNNAVACASCHRQEFGFSDPNRRSFGFAGGLTGRHSMSLANARYYARGRFFWDERAASLEEQVLGPIQDGTEMGMTLSALVTKLAASEFYPPLFQAAFGTPEITSQRISLALAQFVRSLVSTGSKLDSAFTTAGTLNLAALTAQEQQGLRLFGGIGGGPGGPGGRTVGCIRCHATSAVVSDNIHNNGLDANTAADQGAGGGRFKAPSLRNIAVTAPYMHDGRFATLEEVVEFYNSGVQAHPNLDNRLETNAGQPVRLNLSQAEKDALIAFMRTLTDPAFLSDPRFANPF